MSVSHLYNAYYMPRPSHPPSFDHLKIQEVFTCCSLTVFCSIGCESRLTCSVLMSEHQLAFSLHAPAVTHNSICLWRAAEVLPPRRADLCNVFRL